MRSLLYLLFVSSYLLSTADADCLYTKCADDSATVYMDDGSNAITPSDKIAINVSLYGCSIEVKLVASVAKTSAKATGNSTGNGTTTGTITAAPGSPTIEVIFKTVPVKTKEIADFPGENKCRKIKEMEHAICYCSNKPLCNMDVNHWLKEAEMNIESRFKYETGGYCFPDWGVIAIACACAVILIASIIGCIVCCIKCCCKKSGGAPAQ